MFSAGYSSGRSPDATPNNSRPPESTSAEAAAIILKGVLKNKPQILVGSDAKVMALIERLAPTGYMKLLQVFFGDKEASSES